MLSSFLYVYMCTFVRAACTAAGGATVSAHSPTSSCQGQNWGKFSKLSVSTSNSGPVISYTGGDVCRSQWSGSKSNFPSFFNYYVSMYMYMYILYVVKVKCTAYTCIHVHTHCAYILYVHVKLVCSAQSSDIILCCVGSTTYKTTIYMECDRSITSEALLPEFYIHAVLHCLHV